MHNPTHYKFQGLFKFLQPICDVLLALQFLTHHLRNQNSIAPLHKLTLLNRFLISRKQFRITPYGMTDQTLQKDRVRQLFSLTENLTYFTYMTIPD